MVLPHSSTLFFSTTVVPGKRQTLGCLVSYTAHPFSNRPRSDNQIIQGSHRIRRVRVVAMLANNFRIADKKIIKEITERPRSAKCIFWVSGRRSLPFVVLWWRVQCWSPQNTGVLLKAGSLHWGGARKGLLWRFYVSFSIHAEAFHVSKQKFLSIWTSERAKRDKGKRGRNTEHRQARTHKSGIIGDKRNRKQDLFMTGDTGTRGEYCLWVRDFSSCSMFNNSPGLLLYYWTSELFVHFMMSWLPFNFVCCAITHPPGLLRQMSRILNENLIISLCVTSTVSYSCSEDKKD